MRTCLIKPYGFMGDALFAASAARKLKEEDQFDVVDLATGLKQVEELLAHDEYIDHIVRVEEPTITPLFGVNVDGYDRQFELSETHKVLAPPLQAQFECGVRKPDTKFEIIVDPEVVGAAKKMHPKPYVAFMEVGSWKEKAFRFTEKQYAAGVDVPYLGYGGRLRDIYGILERLQSDGIKLIPVGLKAGMKSLQATKSLDPRNYNEGDCYGCFHSMTWDAAVIQNADYFIGAEGGLSNIAAAVGTKCILGSEFLAQLYGPNGLMLKLPDGPKLGSHIFFPDAGHSLLNPFLTDDEFAETVLTILKHNIPTIYSWKTNSGGTLCSYMK